MEPWGEDRADFRIAQLAVALESLVRGDEAGWSVWDFMLPHMRPHEEEEETDLDPQAEFERFAAAYCGLK